MNISLLKKLFQYPKNKSTKELINHSLVALIIRTFGAGAAFIMSIVVSRYLGAEGAGYLFLGITVSTLIATLGRVGADLTVLKYISIHASKNEWPMIAAVLKILLQWTYIPTLILSSLICCLSKPIAIHVFNKPEFQWPLFWTSLSIPFFAGYNVYGMALQAIKKILLSVSGLRVLTPIFLILFFLTLTPKDANSSSFYYFLATVLNFIINIYWWKKSTPEFKETIIADKSMLWNTSKEFWMVATMQQLVLWSGQFVAGIFINDPAQIAQLAVARNTASLITFVLQAVNNVSAPRFATMAEAGNMTELKNYAKKSTRLMTIIALPITVALCLFPKTILKLFGNGFEDGVYFLIIIAIGQFINVSTGSVAYLLSMSGYEKQLRNSRIISGMAAILLALVLTPIFGALGSAISTSMALIISNILALYLVKKHLGFSTMSMLGK